MDEWDISAPKSSKGKADTQKKLTSVCLDEIILPKNMLNRLMRIASLLRFGHEVIMIVVASSKFLRTRACSPETGKEVGSLDLGAEVQSIQVSTDQASKEIIEGKNYLLQGVHRVQQGSHGGPNGL
jgi:hypothetical protein